jgi:ATP-dependent DNA ligase
MSAEKMKGAVWLKPERRCEVWFREWTEHGRLRHAKFRELVS